MQAISKKVADFPFYKTATKIKRVDEVKSIKNNQNK